MKRKGLLALTALFVLSVGALAYTGLAAAAPAEGSAENPVLKLEWSAPKDGAGAGHVAIYKIFGGVWELTPNGAPVTFSAGDRLVYDVYVPAGQFQGMTDKDGNALTLENFEFGGIDLQRDEAPWDAMFGETRGLADTDGFAYERQTSPDRGAVTAGLLTRTVDLTPLAGFKTAFSGMVHLYVNAPLKAKTTFTVYLKNIRFETAAGTIYLFEKTDLTTRTAKGVYRGDLGDGTTQQGLDAWGKYTDTVWCSKDIDLTVTCPASVSAGRIAGRVPAELLYEYGKTGVELDLAGISAVGRDGETPLAVSHALATEGGEPVTIPESNRVTLEKGSYVLISTAVDTTDGDNLLRLMQRFTVGEDSKPVIGDIALPERVKAGERVTLPGVTALNPLDMQTPLPCEVTVADSRGRVYTPVESGEERFFTPENEGRYTLTYAAENATARVTRTVELTAAAPDRAAIRVELQVPENLRAAGQQKFAAMNVYSLNEGEGPLFSSGCKLSYEVYSPDGLAGLGYLGLMTDRGNGAGGYGWDDTDYNRGQIQSLTDSHGHSMATETDLSSEIGERWYRREYRLPDADRAVAAEAKVMNVTAVVNTADACGERITVFYRNVKLVNAETGATVFDFSGRTVLTSNNVLPASEPYYPQNGAIAQYSALSAGPVAEISLASVTSMRGMETDLSNLVAAAGMAADAGVTVEEIAVSRGGEQIPLSGGKFTPAFSGDYGLTYLLSYRVNGRSYTVGGECLLTVAKYNVKPVIQVSGSYKAAMETGESITVLAAAASNPIGEELSVTVTILRNGAVVSSGVSAGSSFLLEAAGTYIVRYTATDADGNATIQDCEIAVESENPQPSPSPQPSPGGEPSEQPQPSETVPPAAGCGCGTIGTGGGAGGLLAVAAALFVALALLLIVRARSAKTR